MARVAVGEEALVRRPRCGSRAPRRAASRSSLDERPGSSPGNIMPEHAEEQVGVDEVGADRLVDAGVLHLHRDRACPSWVTARCTWPIDAAAIGIGSHSANTRSGSSPSSVAHDLRAELGRHRRRVLLQRRERVAHRLGQAVVEVARHLAELHQRALHVRRARRRPARRCAAGTRLRARSRRSGGAVASRVRCTA